jgi:hypothetical protein
VFHPREAGLEFIEGTEGNPLAVEFHFDKVESLPDVARWQVPAQIRVLGQKLPKMECQIAFVADDYAFTGIKYFHCRVKMGHSSEKANKFLLKIAIFTGW